MDAKRPIAAEDRWTTRRLLRWMSGHFEERSIDSPRVCAEMLLSAALGCERLALYMDPDRPASDEERARLRDFVRRVAANEPVQFVVGEAWFFSRPFHVSPATLIPRPSTERLVEEAVQHLRRRGTDRPASVLDLCTGSGCIAVSIALARGVDARVTATDLAPTAIELAKRNAVRHGAERIDFRVGDLFAALRNDAAARADASAHGDAASGGAAPFDLITANPPYVTDAEWPSLPPNVRDHEPPAALRGGADGLDLVRRIVAEAPSWLAPGGLLLVEVGHGHRRAALELAASNPALAEAEVLVDHEGIDRVLRAVRR